MTARRPAKYPVVKLDVVREATAECQTCWRGWDGPNALGVGARHAASTGHEVHAYSQMTVTYLGRKATP